MAALALCGRPAGPIIAKVDDVAAVAEARDHTRLLWMTCVIAGQRRRFHEFLERGLDHDAAQEELYVDAFGARPAGPPFPRLIAAPEPWREDR